MNMELLIKKMDARNISKDDLAKLIGKDRATVYRRLAQDGEPFTIKEANIIAKALALSAKEAAHIFFAK